MGGGTPRGGLHHQPDPKEVVLPKMMAHVRGWVAACEGCQKQKRAHFCCWSPLQVLVLEGPWNQVAMDLMDLLPETRCRIWHILVVADTFRKWVEAFPVPSILTKEVICRGVGPEAPKLK